MLAKFYPGSAYCLGFGLEEKFGQWLEDHAHGQQYGMYGPDHYEIAYEIEQQHAPQNNP